MMILVRTSKAIAICNWWAKYNSIIRAYKNYIQDMVKRGFRTLTGHIAYAERGVNERMGPGPLSRRGQ